MQELLQIFLLQMFIIVEGVFMGITETVMCVYLLQLEFMKSSTSPFTSMFEKLNGLYISHPHILFWSLPVYFPWSFFKITCFLMSKCYPLLSTISFFLRVLSRRIS